MSRLWLFSFDLAVSPENTSSTFPVSSTLSDLHTSAIELGPDYEEEDVLRHLSWRKWNFVGHAFLVATRLQRR